MSCIYINVYINDPRSCQILFRNEISYIYGQNMFTYIVVKTIYL